MMILLQKKVPVLVEFHKKHVARKLVTRAIKNTQDKDQGEDFVTAKHHMMIVNHMLFVMMYIVIMSGFIVCVLR